VIAFLWMGVGFWTLCVQTVAMMMAVMAGGLSGSASVAGNTGRISPSLLALSANPRAIRVDAGRRWRSIGDVVVI
jgi:hypothetical protein